MKLELGFSRVESVEVPLFVPDLFTVGEDGRINYTTPIGDPQFTAIIRPLKDEKVKAAFDAYLDGVAQYFVTHAPKTPGREQTPDTMTRTKTGRKLHRQLVIDVIMTAMIGWKNAPVYNEAGEIVANAPFDAEVFRAALEDEQSLVDQIFLALTDTRGGKQIRLAQK